MGNIKSQLLDPLSKIAADNCKVTYSFGNGRSAGFEPRLNTGLVTAAFNDDLTDCVEVFTPFSAFSHLGNGEGLFRNARDARELALPYFGEKGQYKKPPKNEKSSKYYERIILTLLFF